MGKPMNIAQAAEFLGYTEGYIKKMMAEGGISYYQPMGKHGAVFFKQEDLEAFCYRERISADYELEDETVRILNGEGRGKGTTKCKLR